MAYVDELEERDASTNNNNSKKNQINKIYYSVLVKAALPTSTKSNEPGQNLDQVNLQISECLKLFC